MKREGTEMWAQVGLLLPADGGWESVCLRVSAAGLWTFHFIWIIFLISQELLDQSHFCLHQCLSRGQVEVIK